MTDKQVGDPDDILDLNEMVLIVSKQTGEEMTDKTYSTRHGRVIVPSLDSVLQGSTGECVAAIVSATICVFV